MAYPADFKYTKEHEWIKADGKTATIGITNHAQEALGDKLDVEGAARGGQGEGALARSNGVVILAHVGEIEA